MEAIKKNWPAVVAALVLAIAYFLPWLNWNGTLVAGSEMATGEFFAVAEAKYEMANPFPQYAFVNKIFWLIPAAAILFVVYQFIGRKNTLFAYIAAGFAIALLTVYVLFTQTIIQQVGLIKELLPAISYGAYLAALAALVLVFSLRLSAILKVIAIIGVPLITWASFIFITNRIMKDHDATENIKPNYVVTSQSLLQEFTENSTAANAKYREQILEVNGPVSEVEVVNDSTVNVKFVDSLGSYIIFSFEPPYAAQAQKLTEGEEVSFKGSCSGGDYSEILEVHSINFKRAVINKK